MKNFAKVRMDLMNRDKSLAQALNFLV